MRVEIVPNMPMSDYHAKPGLSSTPLRDMVDSPLLCRWNMDHQQESAAMTLGTVAHAAVLEPEEFALRYVEPLAKLLNWSTTEGKREKHLHALHAEKHKDKIVLSPAHAATLKEMRLAFLRPENEDLRALLTGCTHRELSLFWWDEEYGMRCKSRLDMARSHPDTGLQCDMKTTSDATPASWWRSVRKYRYYMQAAFYLRGAKQAGVEAQNYVWACFQTTPPYDIVTYPVSADDLRLGADLNKYHAKRFKECSESGEWPGLGIQKSGGLSKYDHEEARLYLDADTEKEVWGEV